MKNKLMLLAAAAASLGLLSTQATFAAGSHDHSPKFGGIVAAGKAFDAELVAKPDLITVYLGDHGKPLASKGAKAKLTMLTGDEKSEVALEPAGESKLEAKGKFNVSKGTKAVLEVTLEGKKPSTVRFEIK
jgi:hypothetical protein